MVPSSTTGYVYTVDTYSEAAYPGIDSVADPDPHQPGTSLRRPPLDPRAGFRLVLSIDG